MKDDRLYLYHMLERCRRITRFIGPGRETFMTSEEVQDAVIRNLEVIGEAAKRVSAESRVRLDEVWNVASSRIPELQAALEQFLGGERPGSAPVP